MCLYVGNMAIQHSHTTKDCLGKGRKTFFKWLSQQWKFCSKPWNINRLFHCNKQGWCTYSLCHQVLSYFEYHHNDFKSLPGMLLKRAYITAWRAQQFHIAKGDLFFFFCLAETCCCGNELSPNKNTLKEWNNGKDWFILWRKIKNPLTCFDTLSLLMETITPAIGHYNQPL